MMAAPPKYEDCVAPPAYDAVVAASQLPRVTATRVLQPAAVGKTIGFVLNGKPVSVDLDVSTMNMSLAEYIRHHTKYTGTKIHCHEGGCGACVLAITYSDPTLGPVTKAINSCLRPLHACDGLTVTTNDGLGNARDGFHPIQKALADHNGSQCGFCSNGMVMNMYALLSSNPSLTELQIEQAFDGNLCRCTGYRPILDAMKTFATQKKADGDDHCEDDSCRKTGCKRKGVFHEIEDVADHIPKSKEPYVHKAPKASSGASLKHKLRIEANGQIWQDCPSIDDLNFWLQYYTVQQQQEVMLVVAQTSLGVYPEYPAIRLNINGIAELSNITQNSLGITIGASVPIGDVLQYFRTATAAQPYQTAHLAQAANHLQRVASKPIRNIASIMGNVALAHKYQSATNFFASDVVTMLYGVDAVFTTYNTSQQTTVQMSTEQLFATPLVSSGIYVKNIFIPWGQPNEYFMTYKIALRQVNSHMLVNAAMKCVVTGSTISNAVVVIGGVDARSTRYKAIEAAMNGQSVASNSTLTTIATQLQSLLNPVPFGGNVTFRKTVALNFFYKFWLYLQGTSVEPALQTGQNCWMTRPVSVGTQAWQPNPAEYPVSIGMPKVESIQQTSGHAIYTEDIPVPRGTLFARLVLGKQANSTFTNVDISVASTMPGFVAYYGVADIDASVNQWQNGPVFSPGPLSYWGQSIGVILATTPEYAMQIESTVVVTYSNVKTPIVTVSQAIAANSFFPSSVNPPPVARGDSQTALASAPVKIVDSVELGYQYAFHMENHNTLAIPVEDVLEVHTATQMPVVLQQCVSGVTGYPMSKIVVSTKRCGGGFGGKLTNSQLPAMIAAFCSVKQGAPVKIVVDLQETSALLGCRGSKIMNYSVGVNPDGTILALEANVVCAAGTQYMDEGGAATVTIHSLDNAYYIPNATLTAQMAQMNVPAMAPVRGPGWVPGIHFSECIISRIASQLNLQPHVVREKNFFQKGQTTCDGMILSYWDMQTIWDQLKTSANWEARVAAVQTYNQNNRWTKRGLGMTPVRFGVGQTGANYDSLINIYPDGTVGITHGGNEIGQGINTKVIQVAAYKLGLTASDLSFITVNETNTRTLSASGNVTGGSVTSELCSLSVMHACETLARRLAPFRAANQSWPQLIAAAAGAGVELSATGWTNAPVNGSGIFNYNSNAASLSEVELDVLTGQYEIKRADIVFDAGISLNPMIDVGQVEGGFMFGIGYFMQEQGGWDAVTGKPLAGSTWEYKVPCAYDVPEVLNTTLLKNAPNPLGVLGAKAVGEPGVAMASSVAQALEDSITAARSAAGLGTTRWVCKKFPLTVTEIQTACSTQVSQFTLQ